MNNPCHNKVTISMTLLASCVPGIVANMGSASKLQRVMKLTAVLLTACCLQVSAYSGAQVSFSGKDVRLDVVFQAIGKQTGYIFLYSPADLKDTKPVTIDVKNVSIETIMKKCLEGQPLEFTIADKTVFVKRVKPKNTTIEAFQNVNAPPIDVRGRVINEESDPVAGVSIMIKGTQRGTYTNGDGEFTLTRVDPTAILILTAVNIQSIETNINGRKEVTLQVKGKTGKLDEVQVIAYGTTSQRFNVGNVSTIKDEEIQKQPINNPLQALQGRVPGLNIVQQSGLPGAGIKIQIRGQNSINSGNEPLYIVDGVPIKPNLNGLDAVASKFGSGLAGNLLGDNPSSLAYINPSDIESIDILKDAEATAIFGSRGANGVILITTKKGKIGNTKFNVNVQGGFGKVPRRIDYLNTEKYLEMRKEAYANDNLPLPVDPWFDNADLTLWDQIKSTDWQKKLIGGTAKYLDLHSSISGGNTLMQYSISGSYHKETSVFPGSLSDQKGSVHFSIAGNSRNQKFKVMLTGTYLNDMNNLIGRDLTTYISLAPNAPNPFNTDGSLNWAPLVPGGNGGWDNPYAFLRQPFEIRVNNLMSSALLSFKPLEKLELKATMGYNTLQSNSYSADPFSSKDPAIWDFIERSAQFANTSAKSIIFEPLAIYKINFLQAKVELLVGGSYQQNMTHYQNLLARGFLSDGSMKNPQAATSIFPDYSTSQYAYYGYFSKINFNWKNKYILNLSGRRDASSRFGPGRQHANLGSVGTGWIFSEENWIKKSIPFISYGKFRFSYGLTGNDQIRDYRYLDLYRYIAINGIYQGSRGVVSNGLFNPDYSWEKTSKLEMGFELGLFHDRILINTSYYRNISDNQLLSIATPLYVGPGSILANSNGLVQNDGFEFVVNIVNLKRQSISWNTSFNLSIGKNRWLRAPNPFNLPQLYIDRPLGYALFYKSLGVDPITGNYLFADKDNKPTTSPVDEDRVLLFDLNFPRLFGGVTNTLVFHDFQFDFTFQFVKQKGRLFMPELPPGIFNVNQPGSVLNRWQKNGDVTSGIKFSQDYSLFNNYNIAKYDSELGFGDASYIRLKNLSFSYNLSYKWRKKAKLDQAKIYIHGQNLLTITGYKGLDPESLSSSTLPPLRIITFGVQLTF